MKFHIGKTYNFVWPDGAIAEYTVWRTTEKTIFIEFANGSSNSFQVGSDMYNFSYLK